MILQPAMLAVLASALRCSASALSLLGNHADARTDAAVVGADLFDDVILVAQEYAHAFLAERTTTGNVSGVQTSVIAAAARTLTALQSLFHRVSARGCGDTAAASRVDAVGLAFAQALARWYGEAPAVLSSMMQVAGTRLAHVARHPPTLEDSAPAWDVLEETAATARGLAGQLAAMPAAYLHVYDGMCRAGTIRCVVDALAAACTADPPRSRLARDGAATLDLLLGPSNREQVIAFPLHIAATARGDTERVLDEARDKNVVAQRAFSSLRQAAVDSVLAADGAGARCLARLLSEPGSPLQHCGVRIAARLCEADNACAATLCQGTYALSNSWTTKHGCVALLLPFCPTLIVTRCSCTSGHLRTQMLTLGVLSRNLLAARPASNSWTCVR